MELNLSNSLQLIGVIYFVSWVLKRFIVNPLLTAINTLKDAIAEMKIMLQGLEKDQQSIDKRLVAVEESAKSAHHRIDGIERRE